MSNDLKAFGEQRIKEIQAQIDEQKEELKRRNQKIFDKIAELEAQKAPIEKLIKDFNKAAKAAK